MNKLPHFLIIGAGKSGTTSLDFYLKQHPEIFMPNIKEPNFFGYESHNKKDFKDDETRNHYANSITTMQDFLKLFEFALPGQLIGEVSNTTLYMPNAISSIKKYLKTPKFVAILRNPAERLLSRYMHLERVNKNPGKIDDIFDKSTIWWRRADLVNEGFYYQHLSKFYENFEADMIHVILYDEFKANAEAELKSLCHFLNVDDSFKFNTSTIYNKSGRVKSRMLQKLIGDNSDLFRKLKSSFPILYKSFKNNPFMKSSIESLRSKNLTKAQFPPALKNEIIQKIYIEDIKLLEPLLNKSLKHWYTNDPLKYSHK